MIAPTTAPIRPAPSPGRYHPRRLPEVGCNERAYDAQYCSQDKAGRLVIARHDEFGDYACDKTDDDGPSMLILISLLNVNATVMRWVVGHQECIYRRQQVIPVRAEREARPGRGRSVALVWPVHPSQSLALAAAARFPGWGLA